MVPPSKLIQIIQFADNITLTSSGGGTSWEYIEIEDLDALRHLGPYMEKALPHIDTKAITANAEWKLVSWWSVDGKTWDGPNDVFAAVSGSGQSIESAWSPSAFGLHMRFALAIRASTGTDPESATVSGYLVIKFVS